MVVPLLIFSRFLSDEEAKEALDTEAGLVINEGFETCEYQPKPWPISGHLLG